MAPAAALSTFSSPLAAAFCAAQNPGIAVLTSLQQENAQLRAKVTALEGCMRQAREESDAVRRELQARLQMEAALRNKLMNDSNLRVGDEVTRELALSQLMPAGPCTVAPPPGLEPPPGLSPPPPRPPFSFSPLPSPALSLCSEAVCQPLGLFHTLAGEEEDTASCRTGRTASPAPTPSSCGECSSEEGARVPPLCVIPPPIGAAIGGAVVEWNVESICAKLKVNCGFPLLSPIFSTGKLPDMRLMFVPGASWAPPPPKSRKQQGKQRKSAVPEGPSRGALQLKMLGSCDITVLQFKLTVGSTEQGPCTCDFAEHTIQGCELECNWLEQVDCQADTLRFRLEFLQN